MIFDRPSSKTNQPSSCRTSSLRQTRSTGTSSTSSASSSRLTPHKGLPYERHSTTLTFRSRSQVSSSTSLSGHHALRRFRAGHTPLWRHRGLRSCGFLRHHSPIALLSIWSFWLLALGNLFITLATHSHSHPQLAPLFFHACNNAVKDFPLFQACVHLLFFYLAISSAIHTLCTMTCLSHGQPTRLLFASPL
jgi:hypothetical protein